MNQATSQDRKAFIANAVRDLPCDKDGNRLLAGAAWLLMHGWSGLNGSVLVSEPRDRQCHHTYAIWPDASASRFEARHEMGIAHDGPYVVQHVGTYATLEEAARAVLGHAFPTRDAAMLTWHQEQPSASVLRWHATNGDYHCTVTRDDEADLWELSSLSPKTRLEIRRVVGRPPCIGPTYLDTLQLDRYDFDRAADLCRTLPIEAMDMLAGDTGAFQRGEAAGRRQAKRAILHALDQLDENET
jgi:hypothetical protein